MTDTPYFTTFYNMLFHPVQSFRTVSNAGDENAISNRLMFQGLMTVILISALGPVIHFVGSGGTLSRLLFEIPVQAVTGIFLWFGAAAVIALVSWAFTGQGRIRLLLALSAFATLPWLLMGPVSVLQASGGTIGAFIAAAANMLIWLWSVVLFGLAIAYTYRITPERTVVVLLLPFIMGLMLTAWVVGFAANIRTFWPS